MLSDQEIKKVADLASLKLTPEEVDTFKNQLGQIVEMVEGLNEVDTDNVEPTSQTTGLVNVYREDEIDPTSVIPVEEALSQSKSVHNSYFSVPLILKDKES
jgi:aspartyl-tRNA(Asn)/glutamyl-tRNA(Gln) amidotransferase subunit C